jgi:hydroxyethylthiazole kinase-like uncharacterized protein yjeF
MQRAGLAVARLAQARFPHARRIVVLAGAGNNGGDGIVAATHLHALGREVQILASGAATLGDWATRLPPDAAWAWNAAQTAAVPSAAHTPPYALPEADLYLDALLGIGLTGPVRDPTAAVIEALNAQTRAPVLSVDLPSGLDADRGSYSNACVRATVTLSLLGLKPGLCTGPGAPLCGELWSDDLDLPEPPQAAISAPTVTWTGADRVRPLLPNLPRAAHKGQRGDVQIIGGAAGMTGAALLAARAAARLGAGRVFVGLLDAQAPALDLVAPELMLRTPAELLRSARKTGCVVFGPGAGIDSSARTALELALMKPAPLVLDADALNLLAQDADLRAALRQRVALTVLTPHPLEAARLLGISVEQVQADRLQAARDLAQRHGAWVVLKGAGSIMASPQRALWINSTGNGLLATAGSGDVLAGTIAALLSATNRAESILAAVWLHGGAADRYAALHGDAGLSAEQLPQWIARCWAQTLRSS